MFSATLGSSQGITQGIELLRIAQFNSCLKYCVSKPSNTGVNFCVCNIVFQNQLLLGWICVLQYFISKPSITSLNLCFAIYFFKTKYYLVEFVFCNIIIQNQFRRSHWGRIGSGDITGFNNSRFNEEVCKYSSKIHTSWAWKFININLLRHNRPKPIKA